jgi:hypothetical protein
MKIRIPLVGLVKISFKSKKTLDLEHVMESFGKDSSVKFPSKPSVGTFGFTGTNCAKFWIIKFTNSNSSKATGWNS